MKAKKSDQGRTVRNTGKEIYGLLFLAVAVFLTVCLFSYNALDPSFTTLAIGRRVQNPGGIVGAHLADLIFTLWGYGGYFLPLALFGLSFSYFAHRNKKSGGSFGWYRILAYLSLIFFIALLSHLKFGEVELGGRTVDAGGITGWWLGHRVVRLFGRLGSYLLLVCGMLLATVLATEVSVLESLKKMRQFLLWAFLKSKAYAVSFLIVSWVRTQKKLLRFKERIKEKWKAKKEVQARRPSEPIVTVAPRPLLTHASPVSSPPSVVPSKPVPAATMSPAPAPVEKRIESVGGQEPRILPRVDLKEGKRRDQLELISPVIANYQLPQLSFLDSESQEIIKIDEESLKLNSKLLEKKLLDYGVEGRITEIHPGPIITMYEFEPASGVKVNKIVNLEDDLSLTMGGKSVRIIAPLPGKAAVGIEIPNNVRETVWLKEVIGHPKFQKAESKLTMALGKDTEGIPFVSDLAKMPHLLVAGATGSGKSVQVNSIILSLLYKATPEEARLILIDPKMLELSIYQGIPHLLFPVVTHPKKASMALRWAVGEMERRYELLTQKSARNISAYNKTAVKEEKLPFIVIVIDELADLMMTAAKDVEVSVTRLAQMARAAGIHLILATQRPSVDVLTGLIKANFPARISFKVSSKHDSRTIIDTVGAEHLLGSGDMLFMSGGATNMLRVHGAYVSDIEILRVVEHWKKQGEPAYLDESILKPVDEDTEKRGFEEDFADDLYDQAVSIVAETRQASISMIQRRLRIGYNRAARMIERMEKEGVVGPADGAKPREVYASNLAGSSEE